ncbi:MAG: GDSL-type esterase/lipase family protein [Terriglobia bacterium]
MGTFFQALASLQSQSVDTSAPSLLRIIHFGDSHVASDYWAGVLREKLQGRFGNAGPGFVLPGRPWSSIRYAAAESLDGKGWRTDGLRAGENDGVIGLGGLSTESFHEAEPASALATFSQFDIFAATTPGSSCLQVQVDDAEVHDLTLDTQQVIPPPAASSALVPEPSSRSLGGGAADPPEPMVQPTSTRRKKKRRKASPPVPPFKPWPADSPLDLLDLTNSTPLAAGPHRISVRSSCGSTARLLGLELYSGAKGVLYDTDGVNGARISDLEKPMPALRRALLQKARPALIIVSYGTNDIGTRGFNSSEYEEGAFHILTKLKADAGDASILVTGPTDRGSPRKRTRTLIQAGQALLQPALRKAALRAGCAYWDQQAAMGGPGSMTRWVRAGLANYDYVHFSALGYKKLADMLYDQLIAKYSEFRKTQTVE